jgi:hypothetical protein
MSHPNLLNRNVLMGAWPCTNGSVKSNRNAFLKATKRYRIKTEMTYLMINDDVLVMDCVCGLKRLAMHKYTRIKLCIFAAESNGTEYTCGH